MFLKTIRHWIPVKNINLNLNFNQIRTLTTPKKFYQNATITQDKGIYEINLDQRKLRTPGGKILQVSNQSLALMIANEWNAQKDKIDLHNMHLTTLTNTCQDNPMHLHKQQMIDGMLEHLNSDTICFRMQQPEELKQLQQQKWDPILQWFESTFDCSLPTTDGVFLNEIPLKTKQTVERYLASYHQNSLFGFQFILDNLKSIVLSLALAHKHINVEEAVSLSRLELEFQIGRWGSVEWAHDTDLMLLRSRVSAGLIFFILNQEANTKQVRSVKSQN